MKTQPSYGVYLVILALLVLPSAVLANEVDGVIFPSTPFMPPRGFEWVPVLFVISFVAANTYLLRCYWQMGTRQAALIAGGVGGGIALLAIIVIPLQYWWYIRDMHWGGHPLLGWNWAQLYPDFLRMNGLSLILVIFGAFCLAYYHSDCQSPGIPRVLRYSATLAVLYGIIVPETGFSWDSSFILYGLLAILLVTAGVTAIRVLGKRSLLFIGINAVVYLICLIPYIATGAFAHGYGPWRQCDYQLSSGIGSALIAYTRAHQGHLPDGRTMEQVFNELQPYYAETIMGMGGYGRIPHPLICKAGEWYDEHPRSYTWNASFAGKSIAELRTLSQPATLIFCPYHTWHYINTTDLIKAYDDPEVNRFFLWHYE